jgi:CBS domain-containing protein
MTPNVVTLHRNDKLASASDVMNLGRIRHLPVLDEDEQLVGIVSQRDLFHNALLRALGYGTHAAEKLRDMFFIKDAMHAPVQTISPDATLAEAARRMMEHKIGCLCVVDADDKLVGILTEGDFVALAARNR